MTSNLINGKCQTIYEFTPAQLATMRALYEAGTPYRAIAVALGLPESAFRTVSRKCKTFPDKSHGKRARA